MWVAVLIVLPPTSQSATEPLRELDFRQEASPRAPHAELKAQEVQSGLRPLTSGTLLYSSNSKSGRVCARPPNAAHSSAHTHPLAQHRSGEHKGKRHSRIQGTAAEPQNIRSSLRRSQKGGVQAALPSRPGKGEQPVCTPFRPATASPHSLRLCDESSLEHVCSLVYRRFVRF